MVLKSQVITFDKISEFFSLTDELVVMLQNAPEDISDSELIFSINLVEKFIDDAISYTESLSANCADIILNQKHAPHLKEEISKQIALLLISLNDCREKLLERMKNE